MMKLGANKFEECLLPFNSVCFIFPVCERKTEMLKYTKLQFYQMFIETWNLVSHPKRRMQIEGFENEILGSVFGSKW